jgi:hypothetical protein
MWFPSIKGDTHQDQLESFYASQAHLYDSYRCRMLHGREPMMDQMPAKKGDVWVDLGGGTGSNLEFFGKHLKEFSKVVVVDLTPSLAKVRCRPPPWCRSQLFDFLSAASPEMPESQATPMQHTRSTCGAHNACTFTAATSEQPHLYNTAPTTQHGRPHTTNSNNHTTHTAGRMKALRAQAQVAEERVAKSGWSNVSVVLGDATDPQLPGLPAAGTCDVVRASRSSTHLAAHHVPPNTHSAGLELRVVSFRQRVSWWALLRTSRRHTCPLAL